MGIEVASLFGVIDLVDNLTPGLRSADSSIGGFERRLQTLGSSVSGFGLQLTAISAPFVAFGVAGVNTASNFENAMAEISARTGLVGDDLRRISDLALQMGADTAFSAQDAAEAFLQLLSSGQTAEEAITTLPAVLDAAAASGEALGTTADTVTDIMAAFGLGVEDAGMVVDALARAASASSADMASLGQGFGNVGGIARQFGLSVDETAAVLAIFAENGIKGAEAGTQLRSMLNNMARETDEVAGMWHQLGISMFDAQGNIRPLSTIMDELTLAMQGMTEQERIETLRTLGGAYGQLGLAALTSGFGIEEMQARMAESASAADIAAARMDTFSGRMDTLRGSVETLMIQAFTPLMQNYLTPLAERASEVINRITEWVSANPQLVSSIAMVIGGVAALGLALTVAGGAIGAVGGLLGALLSPIGLVVGAVAGLALAYETNFLGIRDFIDNEVRPRLEAFFNFLGGVWESTVKPGLENLYNWFVTDALPAVRDFVADEVQPRIEGFFSFLGGVWEGIRPALESFADWFLSDALPRVLGFVNDEVLPGVEAFFNFIRDAWELVEPALSSLATWFTETALPAISDFVTNTALPAVTDFLDILRGAWEFVQQSLGSIFDWFNTNGLPIIQSAVETVQGVIERARDLIAGLWDVIRAPLQSIVDFFNNTFRPIADNVIRPITDAIRGIIGAVNDALSALRNLGQAQLAAPSVTAGGAVGRYIGNAPFHDYPGMGFAGRAYSIGVGAQPELFIPSTNGTFIPNIDKVLAGANRGESTTINVYPPAEAFRDQASAERYGRDIGEQIVEKWRARG